MICNNCSYQNDERNLFCGNCGNRLVESQEHAEATCHAPDIGFSNPNSIIEGPIVLKENEIHDCDDQQAKKRENTKQSFVIEFVVKHKKLLIRLLSFLLIVGCLLNLSMKRKATTPFSLMDDNMIDIINVQEKGVCYVYNTKGEAIEVIEENINLETFSSDKTAAILTSMVNNCIYYINSDKTVRINGFRFFRDISLDGKFFYYNELESNGNNNFVQYDANSNIINTIDKNGTCRNVSSSPDGKTVAYVKYPDTINNGETEAFYSVNGGEPISLGKGVITLGISNNGDYIYYYKVNQNKKKDLYVKRNNKSFQLTDDLRYIYFNRDLTEIMYSTHTDSYICINGKNTARIKSKVVNDVIIPKSGIKKKSSTGDYVIYGVDTFRNKVMVCDTKTLYLITDKFETIEIDNELNIKKQIVISQTGDKLLYVDNENNLVKVTDLQAKLKKEVISSRIKSYAASLDLSHVYYMNDIERLYFRYEDFPSIKIDSNVISMHMDTMKNMVYFIKKESNEWPLFYYDINNEKTNIVKTNHNIQILEAKNFGITYWVRKGAYFDVYFNKKQDEFELIFDYDKHKKEQTTAKTINFIKDKNTEIEILRNLSS